MNDHAMNNNEHNMQNDIAEGEAWLSRFVAPAPSANLRARIRQSVREELAHSKAPPRSFIRVRAWHGSLAAAAMIAMAVGMAWYSLRLSPDPIAVVESDQNAEQNMDQFEKAIASIAAAPASTTDDDSLTELEELVDADAWAVDGATLYDAFESAFTDESDANESTGTSSSRATRRITTGEVS